MLLIIAICYKGIEACFQRVICIWKFRKLRILEEANIITALTHIFHKQYMWFNGISAYHWMDHFSQTNVISSVAMVLDVILSTKFNIFTFSFIAIL